MGSYVDKVRGALKTGGLWEKATSQAVRCQRGTLPREAEGGIEFASPLAALVPLGFRWDPEIAERQIGESEGTC